MRRTAARIQWLRASNGRDANAPGTVMDMTRLPSRTVIPDAKATPGRAIPTDRLRASKQIAGRSPG